MRQLAVLLAALCLLGVCSTVNAYDLPAGGMTLHLDASTLVLNDGDPVVEWVDSLGNGLSAAQADSARQPTYKAQGINGVPSVFFAGAYPGGVLTPEEGDVMLVAKNAAGDDIMAQEMFLVLSLEKPYTGDGDQGGCCTTLIARKNDGDAIRISWNSSTALNGPKGSPDGPGPGWSQAGDFAYEGMMEINGGDNWSMPLDTPVILDAVATAPRQMGDVVVGSDGFPTGHQPARNWTGHIAEIIMYDHELSDTERGDVNQYLSDKYGVAMVPEPSTWVLLTMALLGLAAWRRRS